MWVAMGQGMTTIDRELLATVQGAAPDVQLQPGVACSWSGGNPDQYPDEWAKFIACTRTLPDGRADRRR